MFIISKQINFSVSANVYSSRIFFFFNGQRVISIDKLDIMSSGQMRGIMEIEIAVSKNGYQRMVVNIKYCLCWKG